MPDPLRILHLEDDGEDAELIRLKLLKDNSQAEITRVEDRDGFLNALTHQPFDLILADYGLRSFNGLEALKLTLEHSPETPFIFVSGVLGEELAIDSLKEGATDYVLKNQLARLSPALRRAMRESKERQARKKVDEQFRAFSRLGQRLSSVVTPIDAARIIVDAADALLSWDACSLDLYSPERNIIYPILEMDLVDGKRTLVSPVCSGTAPSPLMKCILDQGGQLILREGSPSLSPELPPFGDVTRASASLMFVPIHNGAKAVGILSIQSYQPNAYTPEDLDILQALADHCGGALERIRGEEALSRLAAIVESSSDAIIGLTLDGKITSWNLGAEKIFGYPAHEVMGQSISMLRPPELSQEELQTLDRIRRLGRVEPFDSVCVRKDGRLIDVSTTNSPIKDEGGNVIGVSKIVRDITERKQVAAALQKIEDLYRRAISGVGAVPYLYDYTTRSYGFMGGGIATLTGYTPHEMSPALWKQLTTFSAMMGETAGLSKEEAAARMLSGKIRYWRCDSLITTRSGEARWISDVSVQSLDESGKPVGSIGILQDITERKRAESQISAISKLGRHLSSASSPKEVALLMGSIANELFGWDSFTLDLYPAEGDTHHTRLQLHGTDGRQPDVEFLHFDRPPDAAVHQLMKLAGVSPPLPREQASPEDPPALSASMMRVHIQHKNQIVGILSLHCAAHKTYDQSDMAALQTLADYCAGALERMRVEEKVAVLSTQLLNAARRAGMEEVANNVLHNVGNVLNSVNVSATLVTDKLANSKLAGLSRAAGLLRSRAQDLDSFLAEDPQGKKLPDYLETLARYWASEQTAALKELQTLNKNINHIKDIVSRQQSLTGTSGFAEPVFISVLVEDALAIAASDLERTGIIIGREYTVHFPVVLDKMKLMLILVNLVSNARDALLANLANNKQLKVRTELHQDNHLRVLVIDNGTGIAPENLTRIFSHGFTTKERGHGFGLHGSALAAREMGGSLNVVSEGAGRGAQFAVEIPLRPGTKKENTP